MKPGQNYDALIAEIKNISGVYANPCLSTWLVKTNLSATDIANRLKAIDATDKLLVMEVNSNWASVGVNPNTVDWMRAHI